MTLTLTLALALSLTLTLTLALTLALTLSLTLALILTATLTYEGSQGQARIECPLGCIWGGRQCLCSARAFLHKGVRGRPMDPMCIPQPCARA